MKRLIFVSALVLSFGFAVFTAAAPGVLEGFSGLVIWLFLGYCGIIVVAQLIAALVGLRRLIDELTARKLPSRRVPLR